MRKHLTGYALIAPAFIMFLLMVAGPFIYGIVLSFYRLNFYTKQFVGLDNFAQLFSDAHFRKAAWNTLRFALIIVPIVQVAGLSLALVGHKASGKAKSILRPAIYIATRATGISMMGIWLWLWSPLRTGINGILSFFGERPVVWAGNATTAAILVCVTCIAWTYGDTFLLYLAALDGQPKEVHEAARVDGANGWQDVVHIMLPMLRRVFLYQFIVSTIAVVQLWLVVLLFTGGGPRNSTLTLSYYLFQQAYQRGEYGLASAVSVVELIIILCLVGIQGRLLRERT